MGVAGKTLKLLHGRGVYSGLQSTVGEYQLVIVIPTLSRLVTFDRGVISSSIPEKTSERTRNTNKGRKRKILT